MKLFGKTDIGRQRNDNQDAHTFGMLEGETAYAVVCDGMGGANAGKLAAQTAARLISEYIVRSFRRGMQAEEQGKLLRNAVENANIRIYDLALHDPALAGMGTTAVVLLASPEQAVIAHVGDSRAYLVNDSLVQLTADHSVVQSLLESGRLTADEAKAHPRKNVITRAVGVEESVKADCCVVPLQKGDTVLLCTDGLTNLVEDGEIGELFRENEISSVAEKLVALANRNGGRDNITVVTVTSD